MIALAVLCVSMASFVLGLVYVVAEWFSSRRRLPYDWYRECPELRQRSHVHVIRIGRQRWL